MGSSAELSGIAGSPEVAHVADEAELAALLDAPRDWQAVLLGPGLADVVDVARRVRRALPQAPIVVLAHREHAARIQHDLLLAPIGGEPVRCVPLDGAASGKLESHLRQAFLRRRHHQTLRRANEALATPRPPLPPRAPPAMEQLMEATPIPLLLADRDGRLLHRNQAARAMGAARAVTLAEALQGARLPVETLLSGDGGSARRVAWECRHFDVISSALTIPPSLHAVLVILDDVSQLVAAEEERRREAEFHSTILAVQSDIGEGVLFVERDRIVYANDALARMVGIPREALIGQDPYALLAPRERERVKAIHAARRKGLPETPDVYETAALRADGVELPVELSARLVHPGMDAPAVVLIRDVSRRKQAQAEMEQARAGLAQMDKLATIGSLVSGLAHEIRTPLAAIVNEAHLIERHVRRALDAEDAKAELRDVPERLAAMDGAIDRIRRLMHDMRAFMRGEVPKKEQTTLATAAADAVRFFAATQHGRVRVETDIASSAGVEADPAQVQQILINLLQNAAEASPSGGTVLVELRDREDAVVLAVEDRGPGIPPELKDRIFEAFVTTKPRGSGLGLAIVRRLAEIHGARIHVDSEVGRGTRVEVRFPRADVAPGEAPSLAEGTSRSSS